MAVIEAKFALLEVKLKGMPGDAVELCQASFGEAPERLDSVGMIRPPGKLIAAVMDPGMLVETDIHQPIVPAPSNRMNDTRARHQKQEREKLEDILDEQISP